MKKIALTFLTFAWLICAVDAAPKKKPKAPPPKPQPSVKDLALREARKCDANRDGKITGSEVSAIRALWPKNPKSWLYLFDDNGNRNLDDSEIVKIKFPPAAKPKDAPKKKGN